MIFTDLHILVGIFNLSEIYIFIYSNIKMVYILSIFRDLKEKYPTWDQLKTYLESYEGGSLEITTNEENAIIKYDKEQSDFTKPHVKWFRSVVWNKSTNMPVCVSPPKATNTISLISSDYVWQEYLDGVMINMYKTDYSSKLNIVTRSSFDAAGYFYSKKSFYMLLNEAFDYMKESGEITEESLDSLIPQCNLESKIKSYSVSLLLQHPEHRVVEIVTRPKIFVVHTAKIFENGDVEINELPEKYGIPIIDNHPIPDTSSVFDYLHWLAKEAEKRPWHWQGVTIKDNNGNRFRLRTNNYRMIRNLRGCTSRHDIRFAQLFHENILNTYLFYYPEEAPIYYDYLNKVDKLIKTLYNYYVRIHITKTMKTSYIQSKWRPHIFSLHGMYLYSLREAKQFIREKDVGRYVQALPWQQLLNLLKGI